MQQNMNENKVS